MATDKDIDYEKIGLKAGIECHQQLDTHKLFCECPSLLRQDKPDVIIKRRQYAVAGETGKIDVAAAYEQTKGKLFVYEGYSDTTCQVEFDSEPPRQINKEALEIAEQVALLLNANPLKISQVMRKTVIDGSNTTGFQRTLIIAKDGYVETAKGKIEISAICLEEDAARKIKETEKEVIFRVDRLGIPLVEIATKPDIKTPEEAKEVALKIGEILRACKVKRGIGTIRQDVNLSIRGGARTEIKGVQEPALIAKTIEKEIERQLELIKQGKKVEPTVRNALPNGETKFLRPLPGAARMYPETDLPLVKISQQEIKKIKASLPEKKEDTMKRLKEKGIHVEVAKELIRQNKLELFNKLLETGADASLIAKTITLLPASIEAHYKVSTEKLTESIFKIILTAFSKNEIAESAIEQILVEVCKGNNIEKAISKYQIASKTEIEKEIKEIISKHKDAPINALIGMAMSKLKGKAEGKVIAEMVKKLAEKE